VVLGRWIGRGSQWKRVSAAAAAMERGGGARSGGRRSGTRGEGDLPYSRCRGFLWTSGRTAVVPRGARSRTTPTGPLVAARWYGDAGREAPSACAWAWGRGGLEARVLGRREGGHGRRGEWARRGAGARCAARCARGSPFSVGYYSVCPSSNALNFKNLYKSAPSGE
jgi:hypothetical protein